MIQVEPSDLVHHLKRQESERSSTAGTTKQPLQSRHPWNDRILEPTEDGIESHRKQEAARKTALPHAPGHEELSSSHSCKLHMCGTFAVDPSQETAHELRQLRFLEHMEDQE